MMNDQNQCPRCGNERVCGMESKMDSCWCSDMPVLQTRSDEAPVCYCKNCLEELLALQPSEMMRE